MHTNNMKKNNDLILIILLFISGLLYFWTLPSKKEVEVEKPIIIKKEKVEIKETKPSISFFPKKDLTYDEISHYLNLWAKEAPTITEIGEYGVSKGGKKLNYLRIGKKNGPKVLIMATIHGNEHLGTMTALGVMEKLLDGYLVNSEITELLKTRDIYYIPVVCPDSHTRNTRHDEGLDPNRNFSDRNLKEKNSIVAIQALKEFSLKHNFKAVMSVHNYGKVYFYPWGYVNKETPNMKEYKEILEKMRNASGYSYARLYHRSAPPYYGYENDWFYNHGAFSIVNEIGRSFVARPEEINKEIPLNLPAFIIFIKEAPLVRN
jgi:phage pi2 protein 07